MSQIIPAAATGTGSGIVIKHRKTSASASAITSAGTAISRIWRTVMVLRIGPNHSGPENLKKAQAKKNLVKNQINHWVFFLRKIAFLAVLNFTPVQKLIFGHF